MLVLILLIRHQQVAEQGLTPNVAVQTCNDPTITKFAIVHARPRSTTLSKTKKVDAARGISSIARGERGTDERGESGDQAAVMPREY